MTAQPLPVDEDRINQWLTAAGWSALPFARKGKLTAPLLIAEDDTELGTYYINEVVQLADRTERRGSAPYPKDEGGYISYLQHETHALVFGSTGEGKSACRLVASEEALNRGFLTVPYLDIDGSPRSWQDHAESICALIQNSDSVSHVSASGPPQSKLIQVVARLTADGRIKGVFVLIDNVADNLGSSYAVEDLEKAVRPLFDTRLLGIKDLYLKFFLDRNLEARILDYDSVKRSNHLIRRLRIEWTKTGLLRLLSDRIGQVSNQGPNLHALVADAREFLPDLDSLLVNEALSIPGAPRNTNRLVHEMILSRARRGDLSKDFKFTTQDFEQAKAALHGRRPSPSAPEAKVKPTVFVSYSHKDEQEKEALIAQLGVLQQQGLILVWSDDRISAGSDWRQEIGESIASASVAILLVTANFLTSEFIMQKEVPELLRRRKDEGLAVFPVIAKACAWKTVDWLADMNIRPKNAKPIWGDGGVHADDDLAKIAEEVACIVQRPQ